MALTISAGRRTYSDTVGQVIGVANVGDEAIGEVSSGEEGADHNGRSRSHEQGSSEYESYRV